MTMVLGPLEYLVVGFEDYRFTGQILAELRAAQEKGIIRVVDLCVIAKDEQGNVTARELSELGGEEATELSPLAGNVMRSEEHTSELQSQSNLVCRLLLEK